MGSQIIVIRKLYEYSIIFLVIQLGISIISPFTNSIINTFQGFPITTTYLDIFFIISLILMENNIFDFYEHIILRITERKRDSTFSLFSMSYMLLMNILLFFKQAYPFRLLLIFPLFILIAIKNHTYSLITRDISPQLSHYFFLWKKETLRHIYMLLESGIFFVILFHPFINRLLIEYFIVNKDAQFTILFYSFVPQIFYVAFFIYGCFIYRKNNIFFESKELSSLLSVFK